MGLFALCGFGSGVLVFASLVVPFFLVLWFAALDLFGTPVDAHFRWFDSFIRALGCGIMAVLGDHAG